MTSTLFKRLVNGTEEEQKESTRRQARTIKAEKIPYKPIETTYIDKRRVQSQKEYENDLMMFVRLVQKNKQ